MSRSVALLALETVIGLRTGELGPREIADEALAVVHLADCHRLVETGPTNVNTVWYARCGCRARFEDGTVQDAIGRQYAHQAEVVFASIRPTSVSTEPSS